MDLSNILGQAVQRGSSVIDSIRSSFRGNPQPQPQPQMSRVQPTQPQMSRFQPTPQPQMSRIPVTQLRSNVQAPSPFVNPVGQSLFKPQASLAKEFKTFEFPSPAPSIIKPLKVETKPVPQADRGFGFEFGKAIDTFKNNVFNVFIQAVELNRKSNFAGGFESEFGGAGGTINPMKEALELKSVVQDTPEEYAKKQLALSEAELAKPLQSGQLLLETAGAYFSPLTAFNKAYIQPISQLYALQERERNFGIKATPEELDLASKGDLTRNQISNVNYNVIPELYAPKDSDVYKNKLKELNITEQQAEKIRQDNISATWNDTIDFAVSLIDPATILGLGNILYKGGKKVLPKAITTLDDLVKASPAILADNRGFVDFSKLIPDILDGNIDNIEAKLGKKLTEEQKSQLANISSKNEAKALAQQLDQAGIVKRESTVPPTGDLRIPVPPTTAELRPARYGVAEQEFRDFATTNIGAIADNILPSVSLDNIDNLSNDLAYITSKEAQDIVRKLSNADPKLSQDIAIEAQRQSGKVVDALRASGGEYTPEVMDALTRDNSFRRIIGQQLNGLKNEVDGLFDQVNSKNVDDIQKTIGRKLTPDEISDIKSAKTPDEINKVADDLRATSQKLTKGQERMRFLENQLKDLDNYEEQWKKAGEFMAKNNIDPNNKEEFEKVLREFMPADWYDWVQKLRYNSMLSAPTTLINSLNYFTTLFYNTAKYTTRGILEQTTKAGAKLIGKKYKPQYDALSGIRYAGNYLNQTYKILKGPTKQWVYDVLGIMKDTDNLTATSDQIELLRGNVIDKNTGILGRIKQANKNFGRAFENISEKFGIDAGFYRLGKEGSFAGAVEDVLDIPSNMLSAIDNMMAYITYGAERGAFTKGAKGVNKKAVKKALRDLLRQDLNEEGAGVLSDSIGALADYIGSMKTYKTGSKDFGSRFVRYVGDQMFPFLKVAGNFIKTGLEASPLGVANLLKSTDKMEVLSKMILSLGISSYGINKYASGEITGAYPKDKATRDYWRENGIKPFSVKVGDTWYEYAKFKPEVAVPLMVLTGIQDAQRQKDITQSEAERYLAMASSIYQFFTQQSFVQNLGLLNDLENLDTQEQALNQLGANTAVTFLPFAGTMRWLGRLQNGELKDPQTFQEYLVKDLPFLKANVPAKLDPEGNKIIDEYRVYNSVPLFGKKSKPKDGAIEGLGELRNDQFIKRSKLKIQELIDEDVKRVKGGQLQRVEDGEAVKFIDGLNKIDPINIYWYNPVAEEIETLDISFTKYNPQDQKQLKTYENKYNKLVNDVQYNPYLSPESMNSALNRLDVPQEKRLNIPQAQKEIYFILEKPPEKQKKIKATEEERQKNIQFSQLRGQLETQLPFQRLQASAQRAGRRKPRIKKPKMPKTKLAKVKVGQKLARPVKLKPRNISLAGVLKGKLKVKPKNFA
jgi:hypothetical protein